MKVLESSIEVLGNMQVKKNYCITCFHAGHKVDHSMAIDGIENHSQILLHYDSVF